MQKDELIRYEIESMLRHKIGLNPESVGSRSILRAVKKGMRTGKMQGLSDYLTGLQASPELFESLVESVVVPETSFFRNRASFVFLRQWVAHEWNANEGQKGQKKRVLRVLSLPCSTGEEPYSIAITLLEEGLALEDFHVDAVDISARALEKAKQGVYSPYAFRRQTYRSDDKYFRLGMPEGVTQSRRVTQRYFLTDMVRDKVCFRQGNILNANLLLDQPPYDVVFCRNLLIYFDQDARDRTFKKLTQLLRPNGLLFLGYAETSMVDNQLYRPIPYPQTFAYRKLDPASSAASSAASSIRSSSVAPQAELAQTITMPALSALDANPDYTNSDYTNSDYTTLESSPLESSKLEHKARYRPASSAATSVLDSSTHTAFATSSAATDSVSLPAAQQLADSGDIDSASALCDRYLAIHPSEAAAHLLRGELHQAAGDEQAAETCFEKAIYLDPHLTAALTHLMLLKEEKQDTAGAAVIRQRLQRLS